MAKVLFSRYYKNLQNAGPKAKIDIEKILEEKFDFRIITINEKKKMNKFWNLILLIETIIKMMTLKKEDIVCFQFPFSYKAMKFCKNKKICIIHDLNGLRYNDEKKLDEEINAINYCNKIIAHNDRMKEELLKRGIDKNKIIVLELFDYLTESTSFEEKKFNPKELTLVYPGNLAKEKSPFIYQLDEKEMNFIINLYGNGLNLNNNNKLIYKGSFSPNSLEKINGDIGLIWDGNNNTNDENYGFKNYTKYNNPHKVSCCLARGIPIIVWEKSAISDFVKKNNIGWTINNIYDINKINFSDYKEKKKNAINIGKKVRKGYFISNAIKKSIE